MFFFVINQDMPRPYQCFFQDTASPVMSAIMDLHSHIAFFLILVFIFVSFQIFDVLYFFRVDRFVFKLIGDNDMTLALEKGKLKFIPRFTLSIMNLSPRITLPIVQFKKMKDVKNVNLK